MIISTYSIWNLLAILSEGAAGSTANQLSAALRIPRDSNVFRVGYKAILSTLNVCYSSTCQIFFYMWIIDMRKLHNMYIILFGD